MPNWCNNSIEIVGPRDKIRAVWEAAKQENKGLLNALRPMPEGLDIVAGRVGPEGSPEQVELELREAENLAKHGARNWYDWSVSNWGTKWEISLEGLEYEEDEDGNYDNGGKGPHARITGWFDSAWAPPVTAFAHYGSQNEDVKITLDYNEPGMAFVGRYTIENGEEDDEYYDYGEFDSKTVRAAIGSEMDDFWNISEQMAEYEADMADEEDA
jgi:hypothetical protein